MRIAGTIAAVAAWCGAAAAATLHVSPSGNDAAPGTAAEPLATVQAALRRIGPAGGGEVVLLDGSWDERERIAGAFAAPVTIRAARPSRAVLRECLIHEAENVVVSGVRFDGRDNPRVANVCQVSRSGYVTLRDCEFRHGAGGHDNADSLKVNDGSHHVLVERCRFGDGTDEELDVLQADVHDLVFRDNVFLQETARKPEAGASVKKGARRVVFAGNVFTAMNPDSSNGALRFGGSETTAERPHDLLAIDNVFVHNAGRCDLNLGGATRALVVNNVFFHPAGGLPTPYALRNGTVERFTIRGNVYFNGGRPVAAVRQGRGFFDPAGERGAVVADPLFVGPLDFDGVPATAWRDALAFRDGSPARAGRVPLEELELPDSLRDLLRAVIAGAGDDDWYRRIRRE